MGKGAVYHRNAVQNAPSALSDRKLHERDRLYGLQKGIKQGSDGTPPNTLHPLHPENILEKHMCRFKKLQKEDDGPSLYSPFALPPLLKNRRAGK